MRPEMRDQYAALERAFLFSLVVLLLISVASAKVTGRIDACKR